jgi:hypothetical protein
VRTSNTRLRDRIVLRAARCASNATPIPSIAKWLRWQFLCSLDDVLARVQDHPDSDIDALLPGAWAAAHDDE